MRFSSLSLFSDLQGFVLNLCNVLSLQDCSDTGSVSTKIFDRIPFFVVYPIVFVPLNGQTSAFVNVLTYFLLVSGHCQRLVASIGLQGTPPPGLRAPGLCRRWMAWIFERQVSASKGVFGRNC